MIEAELLNLLRAGAQLHHNETLVSNDFRPDETVTEYLLTAAFLRAIIKERMPVRVEAQCKKLVNAMTSSATLQTRKSFGKKRIDILIGEQLVPSALIEIKIGVRSSNKLVDDIDKILTIIGKLDRVKQRVLGALAFEIFVRGSGSCVVANDFEREYSAIEAGVKAGLQGHVAAYWPNYEIDVSLSLKRFVRRM